MDARALFTKVKVFDVATMALMETAMNAFLAGAGSPVLTDKSRVVDLVIRAGGAGFTGYITYTE